MIKGIGVDLVDVERMAELIRRHGVRAEERLFTAGERETCRSRKVRRAECYAARFAAKEAALKALGTGLSQGISWQELEVVRSESGDPELRLHGTARTKLRELTGPQNARIHVSLAHATPTAVAVVVVESFPIPD